jgi:5'-3' exonuclease
MKRRSIVTALLLVRLPAPSPFPPLAGSWRKRVDADEALTTPGTPFMVKLSEQLRYFVNKKISEDANWREVQVVLSGHEVPGEGEHKIMEYIRLSKAQPDYNPNVRHCLYGLDADLIMLGLLSHDPHFCLLREEVKFGPAARKKNNVGYACVCCCVSID